MSPACRGSNGAIPPGAAVVRVGCSRQSVDPLATSARKRAVVSERVCVLEPSWGVGFRAGDVRVLFQSSRGGASGGDCGARLYVALFQSSGGAPGPSC